MAFTYDSALLSTSNLFQVRLMVGDTDSNRPVNLRLEDAEINWRLTAEGNVLAAAVAASDDLLSRWARKGVGTVAHQDDQRYEWLLANARRLRERFAAECTWSVQGISIADKASVEDDADRVPPAFKRKMMDSPVARVIPSQSQRDS